MGGLRCPKCGRHIVRRSHRIGVVERLLSAVYVYPFRCQLCGRRFRALQRGKRYVVQPAERREYERVGLRARAAVAGDRGTTCGLHFARVGPEESIRLRGVVAGLLRSYHDASVPEGPELVDGRFRYLRAADFWLVVAFLIFLVLVIAALTPWFSLCTWGVNC